MDTKANSTSPGHLSRPQAIAALREKLHSQTDADHCVCAVATRLEARAQDLCSGWNAFDNSRLEDFYRTLFGQPVSIG